MHAECQEWQGTRHSYGYGVIRLTGKLYLTHRLAWLIARGPIPKGMCVLHKCDNPPCVNPNHLFLGTRADNVTDMNTKGRNGFLNKTHCKRGHEFTPENTYVYPTGERTCRECARIRDRARNRSGRGTQNPS